MANTIWIIDDDQSILEVLKIILEQENYKVIIIDNAADVATYTKGTQSPNLVIVDIHIAGVDGRDVVRNLKNNPTFKEIPILIMTADIHIEEKAKQAHADGYLKKPFETEAFLKIINKYTKKSTSN